MPMLNTLRDKRIYEELLSPRLTLVEMTWELKITMDSIIRVAQNFNIDLDIRAKEVRMLRARNSRKLVKGSEIEDYETLCGIRNLEVLSIGW